MPLHFGKTIIGSHEGENNPNEDIKVLQLFNQNIAQYNKLITDKYSLDNVNEAIEAMKKGETVGRILLNEMNSELITINQISKRHQSCILAYGHFTTIHAGHIRYLKHAKRLGKTLVVALKGDENIDGRNKYAFNEKERAEALSLLSIADFILFIGKEKLKKIVSFLNPKIVVLGKEFEDPESTKYLRDDDEIKDILDVIKLQENIGFEIEFHAGEINYASTDLLKSSQSELFLARQNLFLDTCSRESITSEKLLSSISSWNNAHLLVIGDTIVDEYAACEPLGLSAEAPVVVVKEVQKRIYWWSSNCS